MEFIKMTIFRTHVLCTKHSPDYSTKVLIILLQLPTTEHKRLLIFQMRLSRLKELNCLLQVTELHTKKQI